jgi:hypothetical protein
MPCCAASCAKSWLSCLPPGTSSSNARSLKRCTFVSTWHRAQGNTLGHQRIAGRSFTAHPQLLWGPCGGSALPHCTTYCFTTPKKLAVGAETIRTPPGAPTQRKMSSRTSSTSWTWGSCPALIELRRLLNCTAHGGRAPCVSVLCGGAGRVSRHNHDAGMPHLSLQPLNPVPLLPRGFRHPLRCAAACVQPNGAAGCLG